MDATGKDTQIKNILAHYPREVFHTLHYHAVKNRSPEMARIVSQDTYEEMFFIMEECRRTSFVLNRSHYGEFVYGKLYRDYKDPEYIFKLEQRYQKRQHMMSEEAVLIVFVNSDYKTLADREDGDSLSAGQINLMVEEYNRFMQVCERSIVSDERKITINTARKSIEQVAEEVTNFLDKVYDV